MIFELNYIKNGQEDSRESSLRNKKINIQIKAKENTLNLKISSFRILYPDFQIICRLSLEAKSIDEMISKEDESNELISFYYNMLDFFAFSQEILHKLWF